MHLNGVRGDSAVELLVGGKQGGSDTPCAWNRVLFAALSSAVAQFEQLGMCVVVHNLILKGWDLLQIWADDLYVFSHTVHMLKHMFVIMTTELSRWLLAWKKTKLEFLTTEQFDDEAAEVEVAGEVFRLRCVEELNCLGIALDSRGSSLASIEHRLLCGFSAWGARASILTDRRIPLRRRVDCYLRAVLASVMHGAGGWNLQNAEVLRLKAFERKCWWGMLSRTKMQHETDSEFHRRINAKIFSLRWHFRSMPIAAVALRLKHSWAGHCAIIHEDSLLFKLQSALGLREFREAQVMRASPQELRGEGQWPKLASRGRPSRWEDALEQTGLEDWLSQGKDRASWKATERAFVMCQLNRLDPGCWCHEEAICPILWSRRTRPFEKLIGKVCVKAVIEGDNQQVVQTCLGHWRAPDSPLLGSRCSTARWLLHCLEDIVKVHHPIAGERLLAWVPRKWNVAADTLANWCLDTRGHWQWFADAPAEILSTAGFLRVSFDGGCRPNPGDSAAAATCWWFSEAGEIVKVAEEGVFLGYGTNVSAEFEAVCLALRLLRQVLVAAVRV